MKRFALLLSLLVLSTWGGLPEAAGQPGSPAARRGPAGPAALARPGMVPGRGYHPWAMPAAPTKRTLPPRPQAQPRAQTTPGVISPFSPQYSPAPLIPTIPSPNPISTGYGWASDGATMRSSSDQIQLAQPSPTYSLAEVQRVNPLLASQLAAAPLSVAAPFSGEPTSTAIKPPEPRSLEWFIQRYAEPRTSWTALRRTDQGAKPLELHRPLSEPEKQEMTEILLAEGAPRLAVEEAIAALSGCACMGAPPSWTRGEALFALRGQLRALGFLDEVTGEPERSGRMSARDAAALWRFQVFYNRSAEQKLPTTGFPDDATLLALETLSYQRDLGAADLPPSSISTIRETVLQTRQRGERVKVTLEDALGRRVVRLPWDVLRWAQAGEADALAEFEEEVSLEGAAEESRPEDAPAEGEKIPLPLYLSADSAGTALAAGLAAHAGGFFGKDTQSATANLDKLRAKRIEPGQIDLWVDSDSIEARYDARAKALLGQYTSGWKRARLGEVSQGEFSAGEGSSVVVITADSGAQLLAKLRSASGLEEKLVILIACGDEPESLTLAQARELIQEKGLLGVVTLPGPVPLQTLGSVLDNLHRASLIRPTWADLLRFWVLLPGEEGGGPGLPDIPRVQLSRQARPPAVPERPA